MNESDFWNKSYTLSIMGSLDEIVVDKNPNTDWSEVKMFIHGEVKASIVLRSQEIAEGLHFLLGQMLGK